MDCSSCEGVYKKIIIIFKKIENTKRKLTFNISDPLLSKLCKSTIYINITAFPKIYFKVIIYLK